MPDPGQLPPSVMQGMGWFPPADPLAAPAGAPLDFGPLPPSIPQGLGWAPPATGPGPDLPLPPAPPQSLPSQAPATGQAASISRSATPDYQVPESAFGRGQGAPPIAAGQPPPAARTPAPARPQTFDQRMGVLDQREAGTEQAYNASIQAGIEATKAQNAEDLAAYQKSDQAVATNAAARKAEQEQWDKIYATNSAQVAADRQQIESWKFNRNAYMDGLGVGDKVRWGIAAILSNVGRALQRQTGPDPIAEMLQQNIHDANEAQFKERDAIVQKLGIDRQSGMDAQQYHATRQAEIDKQDGLAYTALAQQLKEAAVKTGDQAAQAAGMKAWAEVKSAADAKFSSGIQMRSQHDLQQQQIGIAGGELALNRKKFDWEKDKDQQQLDLQAAKLLATKQGKLDDEQAKRAIYIPSPDGSGQLVVARKQDGTPVLAGSADIAAKDQNMVAAASSYNRLVGQMIRAIKDHGGESTWVKGDEWQKMMTDLQSATAELHDAYGITAFREPTVQFFEKMATAGVDPTSFVRNASAALEHSNQNLQAKVNERVSARGYDGPQFGWRDTTKTDAPPETPETWAVQRALQNPALLYDKNPEKVMGDLGVSPQPGVRGTELTGQVARRIREEGGILPSVRQTLSTWSAALDSPDPKIASHYRTALQNIADNSESPQTAAFAQQLLERSNQQQLTNAPGALNTPETMRGASGAPAPRER